MNAARGGTAAGSRVGVGVGVEVGAPIGVGAAVRVGVGEAAVISGGVGVRDDSGGVDVVTGCCARLLTNAAGPAGPSATIAASSAPTSRTAAATIIHRRRLRRRSMRTGGAADPMSMPADAQPKVSVALMAGTVDAIGTSRHGGCPVRTNLLGAAGPAPSTRGLPAVADTQVDVRHSSRRPTLKSTSDPPRTRMHPPAPSRLRQTMTTTARRVDPNPW